MTQEAPDVGHVSAAVGWINHRGVDLHYTQRGAGSPLLLLHGGTTTTDYDWAAQIEVLARHHRVVALSTRGHGLSGWDGDLSMPTLVGDIIAVIEQLSLGAPSIVAFSHGSLVAAAVARERPELVSALALLGYGPLITRRWERAMARIHESWPADAKILHGPDYPEDHWWTLMKTIELERRAIGSAMGKWLLGYAGPTLLLLGDRDIYGDVPFAARLASRLPGGELCVVPKAGHAVQRHHPELVNVALADFLHRASGAERASNPIHDNG